METTIIGMWWLALVLGVLPLLWWLLRWFNEFRYVKPLNADGSKLPPGHMGFPIFGEMLTFLWYFKVLRRPDDFINSKRRKYGDGVGLYRTHLFGMPSIIACFPAVNKFIFQSNDLFMTQWPSVEIIGAHSLVAAHGKPYDRLRSYVTSAINQPATLQRTALIVQPRMIAALKSWAQKGKIVARTETKKVTFENIGRLFVSLEPGPLLDTIDKLFVGLVKGLRANPINFPGTAHHRSIQVNNVYNHVICIIVGGSSLSFFKEELDKKKKKKKEGVETKTTNDLMDGLMEMKDENGKMLRDEEVVDNIISLVIAGYESTALASMWALYYLAKFPNVLKKLRDENIPISQSKKGEYITFEDVSKMKYTSKVVEETVRMANVAAFLFRLVTKDVEYKGYKIPKGWKVILWIRYLHTNSENFDDPMCFNPERWDEPAKSGTYQVFGGGPRICAGNMLARIQLAIFLHHLSVGYKWELLNPNAEMEYLPHPKPVDGIEMSFSKI